MKLSLIATLIFTLQVTANVYSQTKLFDLTLKNVSIKEVFKSIEAQSNFRFFYNDELVDLNRQVTLSTQSMKLEEVLISPFSVVTPVAFDWRCSTIPKPQCPPE